MSVCFRWIGVPVRRMPGVEQDQRLVYDEAFGRGGLRVAPDIIIRAGESVTGNFAEVARIYGENAADLLKVPIKIILVY